MREKLTIPSNKIAELKKSFGVTYPNYVVAPEYGDVTDEGFGSMMEVVLAPGAGEFRRGSPTNGSSLGKIMERLHAYDPGAWIAGHLLNAEFGGSGTDEENLVPLTRTANSQHSKYESVVKRLCVKIRQWHQMNRDEKSFLYCIKYSVSAVGHFGYFEPYNCVPSHIVVNIRVCKYHWDSQELETLENGHISFNEIKVANEEVHNTDDAIFKIVGIKEPKRKTSTSFLDDKPSKKVRFSKYC